LSAEGFRSGKEEQLDVPGVWETALIDRVNYRGQAVAVRSFRLEKAGPARLVFKGVSHTATVHVDGRCVGHHHNAFTPFAVNLPELSAGEHELCLHISNEHGELSGLHVPNDYYNYGGISRPAALELLQSRCFIDRLALIPERSAARGTWSLRCKVFVENLGDAARADLELCVAEQRVRDSVELAAGQNVLDFELAMPGVEAWRPGNPRLYFAEAVLRGPAGVDGFRDRIGFRTVRTEGEQLLLNDEPVRLLGVNRHEDHPMFGCALPVSAMRRDLELIRDMGCNAVRTSHYPNDERFLDLCDELGILVWEENHARGQGVKEMQHPRFRSQCLEVTREMIEAHVNHPSIVMWGVMNECASESEIGREMYAEQFELIKRLDASRPTTFASCRHGSDICQDLPDICSWNVYPRWYSDEVPLEVIEALVARYDSKGMAGKPLIVSETGAGALPGYRDPIRRAKWSEERQADILEELTSAYAEHPRLCGLFIWQFCDVRVDESWAMGRPRTMNNKGVVDEYRRPKLAYETIKARFRKLTAPRP
jgi:beta-glucuronidase